jgi:protein-glutamine gamma-glutamyltransferase
VCFYYESKVRIPLEPPVQLSVWKIGVTFLVFFYFLGDLPVLPVLVSFLTLIMFIKLVFKAELNDYLYDYLIGIVCLLIGAIYARGLAFGVLFLTFYLVLCWVLILYNLVVIKVGSHVPPSRFRPIGRDEIIEWPLFSLAGGLVFGSLILNVIIFVSFPRVELGFFSIGSNSHTLTGFSEKVTLGEVGSIKESTDVVMRVEFSKEGKKVRPDGRFFWRRVALDLYDGKSWRSTARIDWQMKKTNPKSGLNLFAPSSSKKLFK